MEFRFAFWEILKVFDKGYPNLVPRVLWLFGQRVGASRDSGVLEFSYRKISAVKQWKSLQGSQSKNLDFFEFPRVSTGAHPLTKKPEDSGYEIGDTRDHFKTPFFKSKSSSYSTKFEHGKGWQMGHNSRRYPPNSTGV